LVLTQCKTLGLDWGTVVGKDLSWHYCYFFQPLMHYQQQTAISTLPFPSACAGMMSWLACAAAALF
jgi:hypothetical protein